MIPICLAAIACFTANAQPKTGEWQSLFDGKSLNGWREAQFKYHGKVTVENGALMLGAGAPMTGATWTGDFPKSDYEVRFEAERLARRRFLCQPDLPRRRLVLHLGDRRLGRRHRGPFQHR